MHFLPLCMPRCCLSRLPLTLSSPLSSSAVVGVASLSIFISSVSLSPAFCIPPLRNIKKEQREISSAALLHRSACTFYLCYLRSPSPFLLSSTDSSSPSTHPPISKPHTSSLGGRGGPGVYLCSGKHSFASSCPPLLRPVLLPIICCPSHLSALSSFLPLLSNFLCSNEMLCTEESVYIPYRRLLSGY